MQGDRETEKGGELGQHPMPHPDVAQNLKGHHPWAPIGHPDCWPCPSWSQALETKVHKSEGSTPMSQEGPELGSRLHPGPSRGTSPLPRNPTPVGSQAAIEWSRQSLAASYRRRVSCAVRCLALFGMINEEKLKLPSTQEKVRHPAATT